MWISYVLVYILPLSFWSALTYANARSHGLSPSSSFKMAVSSLYAPMTFTSAVDGAFVVCNLLLMAAYLIRRHKAALVVSVLATTLWGFQGFLFVVSTAGR